MSFFSKSFQLLSKDLRRSSIILFLMMIFSMALETLSIGLVIPALSIMLDDQLFFQYEIFKGFLEILGNPKKDKLIIIFMLLIIFIFLFKSFYLVLFNWIQAKFIFKVQIF